MFFLTGLLSACSSGGNDRLNPAVAAAIKKGVTSKDQIRALLGAPQSMKIQVPIVLPPGVTSLPAKQTATEIWAFWNSSARKPAVTRPFIASKRDHASYTVIIFFDAHGIVLDYSIEAVHT
jgi:hypothetical protein